MNFYTVHCRDQEDSSPIIVKEGFNWYHLFFNVFWAAYNRTWTLVTLYISLYFFLGILGYLGLNTSAINITTLVTYIALSFYANDFYRKSIEKNGYILTNLTFAKSPDEALYFFLKKSLKIKLK